MPAAYTHFLRISNGFIPVLDLDEALAFYGDRLGFSLREREPAAVTLARGDVTIRLSLTDSPAKPKTANPLFVVKNIESLYHAYLEIGVLPASTTIQTYSDGHKQFELLDPFGARLRFYEYPEFP